MSDQVSQPIRCPVCGEPSTLVIGPTQAFCTNVNDCDVVTFDPSLPDGGMSDPHYIEWEQDSQT